MPENLPAKSELAKARRQLASLKTVQEVKDFRDRGVSAIEHVKRIKMAGREQLNEYIEVYQLEPERRLGELLADMTKRKNQHDAGNAMLPALSSLGLTKMQSSRAQAAASISEEVYRGWVKEVIESGKLLSLNGLVKLASRTKRTPAKPIEGIYSDLESIHAEGKEFGTIYADPPWAYDNKATRASAEGEYANVMTLEEICNEPVPEICLPDGHLHLWTTNGFLFDAKRVMDAWGFEYKSCFVWVKPQMGIGNYWRVSHEFLLLGVRGKAKSFARHDYKSWGEFDRTEHSRKPRRIREMIETVSPGPYLEMYGRQQVPGWTVYGNQVSEQIQFV